ncbi:MAG: chorismate mutase [Lactobacillales bacterium]|jgi:chorismate mutase|nr:chorismate mutase [Lactobacillales bacterium]
MLMKELREEMDKLYMELLPVLEKRIEISKKIGEYKYEHNLPIYDEKRENQILDKIKKILKNKENGDEIMKNLMDFFEDSKMIQRNVIYKLEKENERLINTADKEID